MSQSPATRRGRVLCVLLTAWTLAACGSDSGTEPEPPVSVTVSPASATVGAAESQTLTASVSNSSDTGVTWQASGGSVSGSGSSVTWTAPAEGGSYTVTATSTADATKSATATITVTPVQVTLSPTSATLLRGEPTSFTATVSGTTASTEVSWSATCGELTPDGSEADYAAPDEAGTCEVTATSTLDQTASATVEVAVRSASLVTTNDDSDDGACTWDHCSIREAITAANADPDTDTLYLGAGAVAAAPGGAARVAGPAAVIQPEGSLPTITSSVTIIGEGSEVSELDMGASAGDLRRAFDVSGAEGSVVVTLAGMTVRNAVAQGGPALFVRDGAEVHTQDVALLDNASIGGEGGAVVVVGEGSSAVFEDTWVEGNQSVDNGWPGGGISVLGGGSLHMTGGAIRGNTTGAWGGAIRGINIGMIELDGTEVSGNQVLAGGAGGGGVFVENPGGTRGSVMLTDVTLSNNTSNGSLGGGGALFRQNLDVTISNSTIADNLTAGSTGGGALNLSTDVTLMMTRSALSGNVAFQGGGILAGNAAMSFEDTELSGNDAGERGGGLFFYGTATATFTGGSITENTGGTLGGAGIWLQNSANLQLDGTAISANTVTADAAGGGFWVGNDAVLEGTDVEIRDNVAPAAGAGYFNGTASSRVSLTNSTVDGNQGTDYSGGGLYADGAGTLALTNTTVSNNSAPQGSGGGVFANGTVMLSVSESRILDNMAGIAGGGLWVRGTTTVEGTLLMGNQTGTNGGALSAGGTTTITSSTMAGNTAGMRGGAIFFVETAGQPLRMSNATLSGNSGALGGALGSYGSAELTHVTIVGNQASDAGGGIHLRQITPDRTITLVNTIFASNTGPAAAENCAIDATDGGTITSGGGNLSDDATCTALTTGTDQNDTEAGVDPELKDNGGPTPTHALLEGSAAIDAGVDAGLDTDQRGFARDESPDVGAVEAGAEG